jgi:DNA-binding GntR family transcriptional regulator
MCRLDPMQAILLSQQAAAAAGDAYALAEADREFHRRLFAEAKLPSLEPLLLRCLSHNHRFKMLESRGRGDLRHTAERHSAIVEAVERRDPDGLAVALAHHVATIFDEEPSLLEEDEPVAGAP